MLPRSGAFDVLDVGAGAGFAGEYLRRDCPEARYFFIEPLPTLEARLMERFGRDRSLKTASTFDGVQYVLLMDVLEHIERDHAFIADLVDRMAPGAQLIVTVPALQALWSKWDTLLGHHRRYTKATLRATIDRLPVQVEEVSYIFPELVPAGLIRRLLPEGAAGKGSGEFPDLPGVVNESLYWTGRCSMPLRRLMPFGSSLCMRARKH